MGFVHSHQLLPFRTQCQAQAHVHSVCKVQIFGILLHHIDVNLLFGRFIGISSSDVLEARLDNVIWEYVSKEIKLLLIKFKF